MLIERKDLTLMDVIALDKYEGYPSRRRSGLFSGRRDSSRAASESLCFGECCGEIDTRPIISGNGRLTGHTSKDMVVAYLQTYHEAERADIEDLLLDKVSDALNEDQKHRNKGPS